MSRKIVIAGGSGFLGSLLVDAYQKADWEVVVFSRSARSSSEKVQYVIWDGRTLGDWTDQLEGADAVINLAGESINW